MSSCRLDGNNTLQFANKMKKTLLIASVLFAGTSLFAQTKKVLFLGNSYTASSTLPSVVAGLANANGDTLIYDYNTPGGYTLQGHSTNATSLAKISAQQWDHVVLQEQSQRPSFPPGQVATEVFPYALTLENAIEANNPCTETVYYMTWGRKYGDQTNCQFYPPLCTYEGMQMRLRDSYLQMANDNESTCAPVGMAWRNSIMTDSTFELYSGDGSHPNANGFYLTACVFYATMWRESPVGLNYYSSLSRVDAEYLQQIAHQTVFDSLDVWRIGTNDVVAEFDTITVGNTFEVNFIDNSANANSWYWDFGTGDTSTVQNPTYTFNNAGNYSITLTATDGCTSSETTIQISFVATSILEKENVKVNLFPNPTKDYINIDLINGEEIMFELIDLNGKIVYSELILSSKRIVISKFSKGTYLVRINKNNTGKIIVQ